LRIYFLCLYDADKDAIKIDEEDIRDVTLFSLRDGIEIVQQDLFILDRSIVDNIRFGGLHTTYDEAMEICKAIESPCYDYEI
jgi:ATP-binding cassette subfamily B protein